MHNSHCTKNVIIFGATGMVGTLATQEIIKNNVNLIIHGKTKKKLEILSDSISQKTHKPTLIELDLLNKNYLKRLNLIIKRRFKQIDFFINAVGFIDKICPLMDLGHDEWDKLIEINLSSNWRLLKELQPLIEKSVKPKIVFFDDAKISRGSPYYNAYAISKSALKTMINIYSKEKEKFKLDIKLITLPNSHSGVYKKIYSEQQNLQKIKKKIEQSIKKIF